MYLACTILPPLWLSVEVGDRFFFSLYIIVVLHVCTFVLFADVSSVYVVAQTTVVLCFVFIYRIVISFSNS